MFSVWWVLGISSNNCAYWSKGKEHKRKTKARAKEQKSLGNGEPSVSMRLRGAVKMYMKSSLFQTENTHLWSYSSARSRTHSGETGHTSNDRWADYWEVAFIHDRTYSEEHRRLPGGVVLCPQVRICKAKMLLQNGLPHLPARVRLGGRLRASENASALDFFGEFYPYPASLTPHTILQGEAVGSQLSDSAFPRVPLNAHLPLP